MLCLTGLAKTSKPNIVLSTPVKPKSPLQATYSFTPLEHDPAYIALRKLMVSHVVGLMPVKDFLSTYLSPGKGMNMAMKSDVGRFHLISHSRQEGDTYFPFITTATSLVPGLSFIDSHVQGDKNSRFSFKVNPNVIVYFSHRKMKMGCCHTQTMEMHVKFKWKGGDSFSIPKAQGAMPHRMEEFVKTTASATETLGQITPYAAAQMSA
ncbi:hypothetical protein J3R83DRAFT_3368 [Lanmaoa asiatica]|nr:hypothetical protein J3R83DRAFT_3368 [Lanmaoa asiatica]